MVGGIIEVEFTLEGGPEVKERGRGRGVWGGGGVSGGLSEVEVPTNEGVTGGIEGRGQKQARS